MSAMGSLAISGVRAHRSAYAGAGLVLAVAAAVVAVTGVLLVAGAQAQATGDVLSGGLLIAVASSFSGTALLVVVMVVASTVSLALRGRRREFALLRAVGTTSQQVRRLVTLEVAMVALVAAPPGAVAGMVGTRLLDPLLVRAGIAEPGFRSPLSAVAVAGAVALVLVTAVPVGRLAAREAARISPTDALRASAVEPRALGSGRRISAQVLAALGLMSAFTPLVVPGTLGSASAAISAFLLVGAGALAGPAVVGWVFDRIGRLSAGPATTLAVRNLRGFSRRLTTVVVPLALVVANATIQTSVDHTVRTAAGDQLRAAIGADLVVTAPGGPAEGSSGGSPGRGLGPDVVAAAAGLPGVASVAPLATVPAQVRTDNDPDQPFGDALAWEGVGLRVVPDGGGAGLLDPGVTTGSLAGLAEPGAIAISTDAAFEIGRGLGDTVALRLGADPVEATVVAVYSRGLGVGDYLTGPAT
ncbi:MAG: ABC transporter permease, partial [Cellulomonas sp.]|nr:ABC transporter permease [Cellulomonas sp.]